MPPPPPSAPASFLGKGDGASADGSVMSSVSKVNSKRKFSEIDTAMFDDVLDNCIVSIFFHFVDLRVLTPLFKQVDQATMGDMKSRMVVLKRNIKKLETQAKKAAETYLEAQAELAMMVYELFKWRKGLIGFRSHDVEEVDNDGKKEYFSMNLPITYSQSQDRGVGSSSNGHQAGAAAAYREEPMRSASASGFGRDITSSVQPDDNVAGPSGSHAVDSSIPPDFSSVKKQK